MYRYISLGGRSATALCDADDLSVSPTKIAGVRPAVRVNCFADLQFGLNCLQTLLKNSISLLVLIGNIFQ